MQEINILLGLLLLYLCTAIVLIKKIYNMFKPGKKKPTKEVMYGEDGNIEAVLFNNDPRHTLNIMQEILDECAKNGKTTEEM